MKHLIYFTFIAFSLYSCVSEKPESVDFEENKALIENYYKEFNRHNWKKMAGFYTSTALFKDPSLGAGIHRMKQSDIVKKYSELAELFPDVHDEIISIYPSGKKHVIVEFISTGTAPDGTKFKLPICTIFTIEKGKITKDFTYYDNF
ncbi:MAG: hypothetical protein RL264_1054 [Bacteroidota bacterium]|jgi:ketosteroid isomerase-like protein